jgi:catechol 2,3-dioxygenase
MKNRKKQVVKNPQQLSSATQLGHVHLTVADLSRQIAFYREVLGMQVHWQEGASAGLGAGQDDLLRLTEMKGARRPQNATGLYHYALLYPDRKELARAVARLFQLRYPNAPTDHVVSETTYLEDPEGQTIELYIRTLGRGIWEAVDGDFVFRRTDGSLSSGRDPLDVEDLLGELTPDDRLDQPLPTETTIGHVHLWANDLSAETRPLRRYSCETMFVEGQPGSSFPDRSRFSFAFRSKRMTIWRKRRHQ